MYTKWYYGGAFERYPLGKDPYVFENGSIVQVHDIFDDLPEFMRKADVIFTDPPWNQGNMTSFYTKADMANPYRFRSFYKRLFSLIGEINPTIAFVEIGKEHLAEFIMQMRDIYRYVTFYNSTYYRNAKNLCYVVQGSKKRQNLKLDGMDEEDIIRWVCENIEYEVIGDLCMGRGLVGMYAHQAGKKFVGTELNHKRLSVLLERIYEEKNNP